MGYGPSSREIHTSSNGRWGVSRYGIPYKMSSPNISLLCLVIISRVLSPFSSSAKIFIVKENYGKPFQMSEWADYSLLAFKSAALHLSDY